MNKMGRKGTPVSERLWTKVEKTETCWLWKGTVLRRYGAISMGGRYRRVHRVAYELQIGPIPEGLCVCHKCDNPLCVRGDHLFLGTSAENTADRDRKGRQAKGDRNGARVKPERLVRGDAHWTRIHPEHAPRGDKNGHSRFTSDEIIEIRKRAAKGESKKSIARFYNTSRQNIGFIVKRVTWAHIPEFVSS